MSYIQRKTKLDIEVVPPSNFDWMSNIYLPEVPAQMFTPSLINCTGKGALWHRGGSMPDIPKVTDPHPKPKKGTKTKK